MEEQKGTCSFNSSQGERPHGGVCCLTGAGASCLWCCSSMIIHSGSCRHVIFAIGNDHVHWFGLKHGHWWWGAEGAENGKNTLRLIILIFFLQFVCTLGNLAASKKIFMFSKLDYAIANVVILMLMALVTMCIFRMTPP